MPDTKPAAGEPTRYTSWSQVPDGLYTKNQLGRLDPPRRLIRGAQPAAQVLYHGNKYAKLYRLDQSEPKPAPTAAQLASVRRAAAARHICDRCGATTHPSVTPDSPPDPELGVEPFMERRCLTCHHVERALRQHHDYGRAAGEIVRGQVMPRGAIAVMADDPDEPRRLALVLFRLPEVPETSAYDPAVCRVCGCTDDRACPGGCAWVADPLMLADLCSACWDRSGGFGEGEVLVDLALALPGTAPAEGELSYADGIARVDQVLSARWPGAEGLPLFLGWKRMPLWPLAVVATGLSRQERQDRRDADRASLPRASERFSEWDAIRRYGWAGRREVPPEGQGEPVHVLRDADVQTYWAWYFGRPDDDPWDVRFYQPGWRKPFPYWSEDGDLVEDAHRLVGALARMGDGSEPVSEEAPWRVFPPRPGFTDPEPA